jgi:hypothetical protein
MFRDKQVRETQGKLMQLLKLAEEQKGKEWRKETVFPDGQKDRILLDEESAELVKKQRAKEKQEAQDSFKKENNERSDIHTGSDLG